MNTNWQDVARATLAGSESGAMTFPQSVRMLTEAGFDGYAVDFRRSIRTYYMPDGEAIELEMERTPTPVAARFDAGTIKEALREAQALVAGLHLQRLLRQGGRGGLRRLPRLAAGQAGALLRPHRRNPYRIFPWITMTPVTIPPLVIGGIVPAVLLGLTTVLISMVRISIPIFLAAVVVTIAAVGGASGPATGQTITGGRAIWYAIAIGLSWSGAIACISYGFSILKLPIAIVAPLSNSNALVAVILGAVLLSEWRTLNLPLAVAGSLCICGGATLVSLAK